MLAYIFLTYVLKGLFLVTSDWWLCNVWSLRLLWDCQQTASDSDSDDAAAAETAADSGKGRNRRKVTKIMVRQWAEEIRVSVCAFNNYNVNFVLVFIQSNCLFHWCALAKLTIDTLHQNIRSFFNLAFEKYSKRLWIIMLSRFRIIEWM